MARYTGPRLRVMRALGQELPGLSRKSIEKRPNRPGQHGAARRRTASAYAERLREKQKLRLNYGLSEKQFRTLVERAMRHRGNTEVQIVQELERRLDNIVFRAGFARTIPAARQLVSHGHVQVNGHRVDIASYQVTRGDVVSLQERSRDLAAQAFESGSGMDSPWLDVDRGTSSVVVRSFPADDFRPLAVEMRLVVEHYSR
jgi:small subunit ribosomal protein S4